MTTFRQELETLAEDARAAIRRHSEIQNRARDRADRGPVDENAISDLRDRYDAAYEGHGARGAPAPLPRESAFSYRRRLASGLQHTSPAWRETNIHALPTSVLDNVEPQLLSDARAAVGDRTRGNPDGSLREVHRIGDGGHGVTEFHGPSALPWMARWLRPGTTVRRFQTPEGTSIRIQRRSID